MKIKNSILKISLVVAMMIGFSGCGSDGDLIEGAPSINGQAQDNKDPNDIGSIWGGGDQTTDNQNNQGIWGAADQSSNNSNQQQQQPVSNGVVYDLAEYAYNYHTFEEGAFTEQNVHIYRETVDGVVETGTKKETFESLDIGKNIVEYVNDSATGKDIISIDRIDSYEYEPGQIAPEHPVVLKRKAMIGDEVVRHTLANGGVMTCQLYDHFDRFDNSDLGVGNQFISFDYSNVLQINCQGVDGVDSVSFIANGYGQVVSIVGSNVERRYNIVDKGTIQNFTPQQ